MLSLRHIERSKHESVSTCNAVNFDPAIGANNEYPKGQLVAFGSSLGEFVAPDGVAHFASGVVYVMNSNGSTVAKYDFD